MKKNILKVFSFLTSSVLRPTSVGFFISRLFDPLWIIPAVTLFKAYKHGFLFTFVLMIFMLGIPLVLRLLYRPSGWDITQRAHRPRAIAVLLLLGLVNVLFAWNFGNVSLGKLFIFYELWLAGFLLISLFWKISGHAGGIALGTGLIILWHGWIWWPLLLLVPLMGWARVVTKNHSVGQVAGGAVYSMGLMGLML